MALMAPPAHPVCQRQLESRAPSGVQSRQRIIVVTEAWLADAQAEWVILHNHVMSADLGSPSATSRHALEQRLREREYLRIVNLEDHILRRRVGRVGGSTTTREHPPSSNAGSDVEVD